jgi:hypothetical protein
MAKTFIAGDTALIGSHITRRLVNDPDRGTNTGAGVLS